MKKKSWSEIYWNYRRKGEDNSSAALRADEYVSRDQPWHYCPSTHCERCEECRSPNECCGTGMRGDE